MRDTPHDDFQPPLGPAFHRTAAVARHDDPATSKAAAKSLGDLTKKQTAVYELVCGALGAYGYVLGGLSVPYTTGLTDGDIFALYADVVAGRYRLYHASGSSRTLPPQSPSGLRTRRAELVDAGIMRDSGLTRPFVTNGYTSKPMTVWTLTSLGDR